MSVMLQLFDEALRSRALTHLALSPALWVMVITAVMLDLWDGVYTARRLQVPVHSHKLRITVSKISEYWRLMLIGFIIDSVGLLLPFYGLPFISMLLCIGLICVEAKSMFEHAARRKSRTLQLKEIFRMAIDCATEEDARRVLRKFGKYLSANGPRDEKPSAEKGKEVNDGKL